ncbi:MAG TPA: SRPBCC family protein [Halalkalibaculum sp.]|nr:SRPBCC family protein [Halalkalibaculum sp.]
MKKKDKRQKTESYGIFTEPGTIRFERLLPGPIEKVWAYLTESGKRGKWLASGKMELRTGGRVELIFNHKNLSPHPDPIPEKYKEFDEVSTMQGVITNFDPPSLLSYTWGEESGVDSEVTFELTEEADDVRLVLTHRKIGDDPELLKGISAGWHTHLNILEDRLKGNEPKGFWSVHMPLEEEYAKRMK